MVLLLLAALHAAPPPLPAIGPAWLSGGNSCVVIDAPALSPGSDLTIVQPDEPQDVFIAIVLEPAGSCGPGPVNVPRPKTGQATPGPQAYRLRLDRPTGDIPMLGVAFVGRFPAKRLSKQYELRLSSAYTHVRVRSCASSEGVHLSVWSGTPRASVRLWHTYWFVGYDVEPTCTDEDVGDPALSP